ncbi:MAG: PPC domain-containing protein, partial [Caldilineaceae bacterium]
KLQAVSGSCTPDQFEPNNLAASSTALAGDGTKQQHNICGADDADWLALDVTSGNHYVVQTSPVGGESDTVLEVYDPDNNLVGRNDDFSQSVNSQVSFTAQKTGTYHAKVQLYNPTYYGSGTEYEVSFRQGEPDEPVDPEENAQDPQPREEEDPSPSNVRTLILVNRARFAQLYGEEAASRLMAKLDELAADDGVRGEIIRLDRNQQVNQAYANWTGNETNYKSVERANLVTNEIRKVIMTYLSERGGVKFLVLVGDDQCCPSAVSRTTRRSSRKESTNWSATIIPRARRCGPTICPMIFTRPRDRLHHEGLQLTCPTSPRAVCAGDSRRHHRHD